jgi:hypothetical protein
METGKMPVLRWLEGRNLTHAPFFLPRLPQGGEGRGEEANVYKHEPLAPALSPFGGERELFSFGVGIKMHLGWNAVRKKK